MEDFMANKIKNKDFVFKCLKALEAHGKVEEIHTLLTNPIISENLFGVTWQNNENEKCPILKAVLQGMDKEVMQKASNGKDVYYPELINLDGVNYLVYNNWLDDVRKKFLKWTKNIIFPELEEIEEILDGKG